MNLLTRLRARRVLLGAPAWRAAGRGGRPVPAAARLLLRGTPWQEQHRWGR